MEEILSIIIPVILLAISIWYFNYRKPKSDTNKPTNVTDSQKPKEEGKPEDKPEEKPKESEKEEDKPKEEEKEKEEKEYPPYSQDGFIKAVYDFSDAMDRPIALGGEVYNYLYDLFHEARTQYLGKVSVNGIPTIYKKENFPTIYDYYGEKGDEWSAFKTLIGWLFALALAELRPQSRDALFKLGYEYGGYNKYSDIYGYKFEYDPNVARMAASALYAAMRGTLSYNWSELRKDLAGLINDESLEDIKESDSLLFGEYDFYVDLREFMPTAPGPYAPNYKRRPDETYPNEEKTDDKNLQMDRDIHEFIVENCNLGNNVFNNRVVQAIADKEGDLNHLFGEDRQYKDYKFHAVFGPSTIGITISPDGNIAKLCKLCQYISSYQRDVLQSADVTPKQYGRLRPGCSWEKEATPHSDTDDRWNALCNFEIEDNDGCPTGYYNRDNEWVYPDEIKSEKEFVKYFQKRLYANSYPSGHSAGIYGVALTLIKLMPYKADLILRAANAFAVSRTIARYHWTSDTINGRILGAIANALCGSVEEYNELMDICRKEL